LQIYIFISKNKISPVKFSLLRKFTLYETIFLLIFPLLFSKILAVGFSSPFFPVHQHRPDEDAAKINGQHGQKYWWQQFRQRKLPGKYVTLPRNVRARGRERKKSANKKGRANIQLHISFAEDPSQSLFGSPPFSGLQCT